MRTLAITLVVLALCLGTAAAKLEVARPAAGLEERGRPSDIVLWYDDMEGDVSQYRTVDFYNCMVSHFHVDTYMAYEGTHSWWCGSFDYDADGGYGNGWDDRLLLPSLDLSTATYPVLTFAYRHDSEVGHDFTYVQAESLGVFVNLNYGYDGTQSWQDIGVYGYLLYHHDNPMSARFRFISDGAWSDEDGLYLSTGGAFMCDIIKVFDYYGGYIYFYDDVESGGLCMPNPPLYGGDYWHLLDDPNPALSDPHSWWCGDPTTIPPGLVPANVRNGLYSPVIDLLCAWSCTVHFAAHFAIPTVDNDYCAYYGTCDGTNYYGFGAYWGDMGLTGWSATAYNTGFDVGQFCPGPGLVDVAGFLWVMNTTDNGCGPSLAGPAGIMIDDVWMEGDSCTPAEEMGWGRIKAMYR
jgi:hypothetical protein